ncbi:hypothetical protein [Legionella hackeliae]|nr:hypothetical protein [Legionella hackeliae]
MISWTLVHSYVFRFYTCYQWCALGEEEILMDTAHKAQYVDHQMV